MKWGKNNLERHPFCFLCKRKEAGAVGGGVGGAVQEMEIYKDGLLRLHGIKKKFSSVGV